MSNANFMGVEIVPNRKREPGQIYITTPVSYFELPDQPDIVILKQTEKKSVLLSAFNAELVAEIANKPLYEVSGADFKRIVRMLACIDDSQELFISKSAVDRFNLQLRSRP